MENSESLDTSKNPDLRITQQLWENKFSELRQEASDMATRHRQRLQDVLAHTAPAEAPQPTRVRKVPPPPPPKRKRKPEVRQNFDRIALWSTIAPSTIAAVFAGVAMAGNNVPLPFALAFVFAWFVLTTGLAMGAVKLLNTRECVALLKSSAPRLGAAAISCALVAVLAVELAHLSITAMATPAPQQVSTNRAPTVTPARAARSIKAAQRSQTVRKTASAGSIHYRTTPDVIESGAETASLSATVDQKVVALPAPSVGQSLEAQAAVATKTEIPKARGQLLGRISAKGKFVARRSSSRGPRRSKRQKIAAPETKSIFEKIFNPVIDGASARAPVGSIGQNAEDLKQISR